MPDGALKIAMIGSRGVPATWGGVERHVEEIGARLVARGHEVTVFSRPGYGTGSGTYRGMRVKEVATVHGPGVEALVHSFNSALHTLVAGYDVAHFHSVGPGLAAPLPRLRSRTAVVQTVHGLDGEREKWGLFHRSVLNTGTWMSAKVPHRTVVVSKALEEHFRRTYGCASKYIPNGTLAGPRVTDVNVEKRFGVCARNYLLYVGRLVPEKAAHLLLKAFAQVDDDVDLVIAGGTSDTDRYVQQIQDLAAKDPRVKLVGYVYGKDLASLYSQARSFVLPSLLEGLPLTVLEAASYRVPLVLSSIPPHLEVVGREGPGARLATPGCPLSLTGAIERSLADPAQELAGVRALSNDIMARYDWDAATTALEDVYRDALGERVRRRRWLVAA